MALIPAWLTDMIPLFRDKKGWEIVKEQVVLLTMQRDDAISELEKADSALAQSNEQIASLKAQVDKLTKEVARLTPAGDLDPEAVKILQVFFKKETALSDEQVARATGMKLGIVKYHCGKLMEEGYLWLGQAGWADQPNPYTLENKGREYLIKRGLT